MQFLSGLTNKKQRARQAARRDPARREGMKGDRAYMQNGFRQTHKAEKQTGSNEVKTTGVLEHWNYGTVSFPLLLPPEYMIWFEPQKKQKQQKLCRSAFLFW